MARGTDPLLSLPDKTGVLYVRLYQRLRALIVQGRWPPGMRLPSSRSLAADLGISRNTAMMALDQLMAEGLIDTRSRAGAYVSSRVPTPSFHETNTHLRPPGKPPVPFEIGSAAVDAFPFERWARLQSQIWSKLGSQLLYETEIAGDPGLRQIIAEHVAPARGFLADPEDIVIVTGAHAACDLLASILPAGSEVVVENPGYIFADAAFTRRGLRVIPVPVDPEGLDVCRARQLSPNPALIVTTPAVQFPTTVEMSESRREALLSWARDSGALVLEDEFDADARFSGNVAPAPMRSRDPDRVIAISSFSRLLFRSLRLGFMAVPRRLVEPLVTAREAVDGFVSLPQQLVLRAFIEEGQFAAHLRRLRQVHRDRRTALLDALAPYAGRAIASDVNENGLHLIARPTAKPARQLAAQLRESGIMTTCVSALARGQDVEDGLLLGFAAFSPDVIHAMRPTLRTALERS